MIAVQTVVQVAVQDTSSNAGASNADASNAHAAIARAPAPVPADLVRQDHRVPAGTSIRTLLIRAGQAQAVSRIEAGTLGLACHGRRAWLDDILSHGSRVEVVEPINVDAKAARAERVAADRGRRRTGSAG